MAAQDSDPRSLSLSRKSEALVQ